MAVKSPSVTAQNQFALATTRKK